MRRSAAMLAGILILALAAGLLLLGRGSAPSPPPDEPPLAPGDYRVDAGSGERQVVVRPGETTTLTV